MRKDHRQRLYGQIRTVVAVALLASLLTSATLSTTVGASTPTVPERSVAVAPLADAPQAIPARRAGDGMATSTIPIAAASGRDKPTSTANTPTPPATSTPARSATTTAGPIPTPAAPVRTPSVVPSPTPAPTPTAAPTATPTPASSPMWAVIGDSGMTTDAVMNAGISTIILRASWREYYPSEGVKDTAYVARLRGELTQLRTAGYRVILEPTVHDSPAWMHQNYADTRYVNQYGESYSGQGEIDSGDVNLVFNPALRTLAASYVRNLLGDLGTDFAAVRLGGGHWGELTYPTPRWNGHTNAYWAFDRNALARSPVPSWIPGQASPAGEAGKFLDWYLNTLVEYQNWQVAMVRQQGYRGSLMMLYPGWGIRPGQLEEAVAVNLNGTTSPEINGEIQGGTDYRRQVAAITDPGVIVTTTWLDAAFGQDSSTNPRDWRPVKYLASLATAHPLRLRLFGENTGQGTAATMQFAASQMRQYGLLGMAWYRESELFSGRYATLTDYARTIAGT